MQRAVNPNEQSLVLLAGKIPPGPALFRIAAEALALRSGCRWAGVGELQDDGHSVQLLSFWDQDHQAEPFAFQLAGSPCLEVYRSRPDDPHEFFAHNVAEQFCDFPLLTQIGARSYRGEVFVDAADRPVGHVFVISERDEVDDPSIREFFRLVAQRVGAEYNRWRAEEALTRRQRQLELISDLAAHEAIAGGDLEAVERLITATVAEHLEAEYTGVWLTDRERHQLHCQRLYNRTRQSHARAADRVADEAPAHFEALEAGRAIAAADARSDPRTAELTASYLEPRDIRSTLDAPIRVSGDLIGVLHFGHVGPPRLWRADEITFATEAAFLITQTIIHRDRRLFQERLYQTQKMESLGVLAGGIAHDFNNILVGVLGSAELALANLEPDDPACRHLEQASRSAIRASELCSQMLAYAGKGQFLLETVDLSAIVADTADLLRTALAHNAALDLRLAEGLPRVQLDVVQLRQVVMNLLTNASESMAASESRPEAGGTVVLATGVRYCDAEELEECLPGGSELTPGTYVYLEVADSGEGMDEATLGRIFEPFFTTKFTGRGLGLAAVLGIVRSHSGGIRIRSAPGQGTTVRVYLPSTSSKPEFPQAEAGASEGERTEGKILLVDDDEIVRSVVSEILQQIGYECLVADGGLAGVELFQRDPEAIDLVLLDVTLPDLPGEQVYERIRERRPDVPVIMASGYSEQDLAERFAGRGLSGFLHKPYRTRKLQELLSTVLAEARRS